MDKYSDIINETWPQSIGRTRMDVADRAKIFGSFNPLKGHDEALEETGEEFIMEIESRE